MHEPPRQIAHEDLMQLPILRYRGPIHLIKTDAELHAARQAIRHERVVGVDTETRPTFHKGQSNRPSLVQIATGKAVYLLQLARLDCSAALADAFSNPRLTKVGIALHQDLVELQKLFPFEAKNVIDLGTVAKKAGYEQTGVRNLTGLFLKGRITKGAQTSNWAQRDLSERQLCYAATDAWVCRELYLRFEKFALLPQ